MRLGGQSGDQSVRIDSAACTGCRFQTTATDRSTRTRSVADSSGGSGLKSFASGLELRRGSTASSGVPWVIAPCKTAEAPSHAQVPAPALLAQWTTQPLVRASADGIDAHRQQIKRQHTGQQIASTTSHAPTRRHARLNAARSALLPSDTAPRHRHHASVDRWLRAHFPIGRLKSSSDLTTQISALARCTTTLPWIRVRWIFLIRCNDLVPPGRV